MVPVSAVRRSGQRRRAVAGFSLIELLLALALGLVAVTGVVQLFVSNSRTYDVSTGQARLQENARFALDFVARAARSSRSALVPDATWWLMWRRRRDHGLMVDRRHEYTSASAALTAGGPHRFRK